jgi:hypothetical protein
MIAIKGYVLEEKGELLPYTFGETRKKVREEWSGAIEDWHGNPWPYMKIVPATLKITKRGRNEKPLQKSRKRRGT